MDLLDIAFAAIVGAVIAGATGGGMAVWGGATLAVWVGLIVLGLLMGPTKRVNPHLQKPRR